MRHRSQDKTGLRPKKSVLVLVSQVCVVKHGLDTLVVIMILQDTATFRVLFIVSPFWSWNITTERYTSLLRLPVSEIAYTVPGADLEGGVRGKIRGSWGRKTPSGVQGRSPGRGYGGQSLPEAGPF